MSEEISHYRTDRDSSQLDDLLGVLAESRRRVLLTRLSEADGPVPLATLARGVARAESDGSGEVSTDAVQQVYLTLYHVHVPKLAAAALVRFDEERNAVAPGPAFQRGISVLSAVASSD
ncbi:MAG: hypothetical protein ABEJ28_03655 [Salinigranum sp.]